ncbi:diaminopropionate ammonia-lyase [Streptomyces triculaminicus]|uniref:diaminopropionate ammonia-lyase n=1 Tax=Streptomyces triculaminicus TaxID=2816232 RepID=UPI0037D8BCC5
MLEEPTGRWYARPAPRTPFAPPPAPAPAAVREFHASLPGYRPTRLAELPGLASELNVRRLFVKDESTRLGLPAFKALGASWAIHRTLAGRDTSTPVTLVTATDGNHGRAVARMARLLGQHAHVFVSAGVHPAAADAIAGEGARVTRVDGSYDEAVRRAAAVADETADALLVQDTAWPGYERVPGWIVEGYSTLFREIDEQLAAAGAPRPDLVVVPVGVGSLAQAAVAHYGGGSPGQAPALLAVEPVAAACVLSSLSRGERVSVATGRTAMAGLNCGTPSALAWPLLRDGLAAAVAVTDQQSARAGRDLAALGVSSGPCGAASLAGFRAVVQAEDRRAAVGLRPDATVVLLSTEGTAANPHHEAVGEEPSGLSAGAPPPSL